MKFLKHTLTFILLLAILAACKKYPEDEAFIHLRRVKNRMTEKKFWHITEYKVNDADSIPYVNSVMHTTGNPFNLENITMAYKPSRFEIHTGGTIGIYFQEDKNIMEVRCGAKNYGLTYPIFHDLPIQNYVPTLCKIRRLDQEVLVLEYERNNKKYRITFETV